MFLLKVLGLDSRMLSGSLLYISIDLYSKVLDSVSELEVSQM